MFFVFFSNFVPINIGTLFGKRALMFARATNSIT